MAFPIMAVMAAVQGVAALAKSAQQKRLANGINPEDVNYTPSPYAQEQYARAQQNYNGRMAGASYLEDNIYRQQANAQAGFERNASSGAQLLSLGAANQGRTNQSLGQLAAMETQDQVNRGATLDRAGMVMTGERDKVHADKLRQYNDDVAAKTALRNASAQNFGNAMNAGMGVAASIDQWRNEGYTPNDERLQVASPNTALLPMSFGRPNTGGIRLPNGASVNNVPIGQNPPPVHMYADPSNYNRRFDPITQRYY